MMHTLNVALLGAIPRYYIGWPLIDAWIGADNV